MSRSTSRRRAAGIGVGALAAVVLAAPSALAATDEVVLDPVEGSVVAEVAALSFTEDEEEGLVSLDDVVSVPASGAVSIELTAGLSAVDGEVTAGLVDAEEYDRSLYADDPVLPEPFLDGLAVQVVEAAGVTTVEVTIPLEDDLLADVDETYLVVDGVVVDLLDATSPLLVALDLFPAAEDDPAVVQTTLTFYGELDDDPIEARAGEDFTVSLPPEGLLPSLGVETLDDLGVFLFPLDELEQLGVEPGDVLGAEELAGLGDAAAASGSADLSALSEIAEGAAGSAVEEDVDDAEPLVGFPLVEGAGTTASVTLAAEEEAGSYGVIFVAYGDTAPVVLTAEAEVAAAAVEPAPTPEPTATAAPVPTPTATTPPRQNPGLRSNTGVETAAVPGLSDGQLAGLGGGLLALGTVAGVAVVRTQRRSPA
ncbi:hypothetical protein [Pseudokineococcus lusitanus]|uniref:Gram-positive cocci surface proteins LPxTG domain-containing protein n=1 Tax=Pseudokineococcus lusitanus TaxID=763993 RepID=A0A3N1G8N6_9ACTN|nr:hypothetical protein [Pseudokineococcus lusitanus]ROP26592.1 hypothetical protein EDC03_3349 [Pseudokineococcus lusitanus]